jgi:hypothetical protein
MYESDMGVAYAYAYAYESLYQHNAQLFVLPRFPPDKCRVIRK